MATDLGAPKGINLGFKLLTNAQLPGGCPTWPPACLPAAVEVGRIRRPAATIAEPRNPE